MGNKIDVKAIKDGKKIFDLWGYYTMLDKAAESGRFNLQGLTPIQSVLASNIWEVLIWIGYNNHINSI